jgi:hypothetical protein
VVKLGETRFVGKATLKLFLLGADVDDVGAGKLPHRTPTVAGF